ncbi:LapA family protein, partial [Acetomicrobium sp. S15 = DSM 107314]|uniref:LapA family protein n=1 Tax=Acetomicrobium sp. S15 = DSM 107314 TaxID=2529858 RepID=UPI001E319C43
MIWQRDVHQGIWEVLVFAAGALLMWVASVGAIVELKVKAVSEEIRNIGRDTIEVATDVTSPEEVDKLKEAVL